jgi:hypothetical protein
MTAQARRTFHRIGLVVLTLVGALYPLVLYGWYIEDAAISFAFARNLAEGEGLVAWAGGERVEGYSNPTWVALMALWELVGVDGFWSSKIMGSLFGAATVPFAYLAAKHLRPDRDDEVPLLAAAFTALSPQFTIWNASGLENSLFVFLLAVGLQRTLVESERGRWPIGPFAWFLLAISRPEGMMYAAIGGFYAMWFAFADGRGLGPTIRWLAVYFVPWTAYQAWHYWYFAWPLPNTYYAKTDQNDFMPFNWTTKGWKYIRRYAHEVGQGYFLPIYLLGLLGSSGWRRWIWALTMLALAVVLLYPGLEWMKDLPFYTKPPEPKWWITLRVYTLLFVAVVIPRLAIGRPGWRALLLAWDLAVAALFFTHWSGGDWMKGFRWMSMLVVPSALLLAAGVGVAADAVQWALGRLARERWTVPGYVTVAALLGLWLWPTTQHMIVIANKPETGPYSIQKRVNYMNWVARRLHIDEPIRNLDVDQGAHVWWSGHQMMDIAGLIDVPMGHHNYQKPFVREYVFEEMRPHFAHAHGSWASTLRVTQHPEWKRDYYEIPGYSSGKTSLHGGNHVRKDLFAVREWTGQPGRAVELADGVMLHGWEAPTAEVAPNKRLYLEVGISTRTREEKGDAFRVIAFLADAAGNVQSWDLPPGYDWWETHEWEPAEIFHGRFSLKVRDDLPEGTYDLGFVVFGPTGEVLAPVPESALPEGALVAGPGEARFAAGEVRWPGAVQMVSKDAVAEHSTADLERAMQLATEGDCSGAEGAWTLAWRRNTWDQDWKEKRLPKISGYLARCWATKSLEGDRPDRVAAIVRARRWDHRDDQVLAAAEPLAQELYAEGERAYRAKDWENAYRLLSDALRCDPSLSWARRWAEEARDHRLKLTPEDVAAEKAQKEAEAAERRAKRPPVKTPPKRPKATDSDAPKPTPEAPSGAQGGLPR